MATLTELSRLGRSGGCTITIDTSLVLQENGTNGVSSGSVSLSLKSAIGVSPGMQTLLAAYRRLRFWRPALREQGWGWQRDNEAVALILEEAGLKSIEVASGANQAILKGSIP